MGRLCLWMGISLLIAAVAASCATSPGADELKAKIAALEEAKTQAETEKSQTEAKVQAVSADKAQADQTIQAQNQKIAELTAQIDHLSKLLTELQAVAQKPEPEWKPSQTTSPLGSSAKAPRDGIDQIPAFIRVATLSEPPSDGQWLPVAGTRLLRANFATGFDLVHQAAQPGSSLAYAEIKTINQSTALYVVFEVAHTDRSAIGTGRILQFTSVSGSQPASIDPSLAQIYTDGVNYLERWFYRIDQSSDASFRRVLSGNGWTLTINHPRAQTFSLSSPLGAAFTEVYQAWLDLNH